MAFNRSGNREMFNEDDEQQQLQEALGAPPQTRPDSLMGSSVEPGMSRHDGNTPEEHRQIGESLGRDMNWMDNPGAVAGGAMARYGTGNIPGAENVGTGGHTGALTGFNTGGWGTQERGTNSIKNTFGKIASRYDPRQGNAVQQILNDPEFKQFFPEAKLIQHPKGDLIDFGDGNPVDVLRNAVEGGSGDAWQFLAGGGGGAQGGDILAGGGMDLSALMGGGGEQANLATESDVLAQILNELQAAQGGGAPDEQQMLQSLLTEL